MRRPLRLTRMGMAAETVVRSLWPLMVVVLSALAAAMMGLHEVIPLEAVWAAVGLTATAGLWAVVYGWRRWDWPTHGDAMARLDALVAGPPDHGAAGRSGHRRGG